MHYDDERTHGCRVSDAWTYRGLKTVVMENSEIRVMILADKGADIYSFVHKPTDTEFMWRSPWGVRDPRKFVPSTGSTQGMWLDYYEGGWQTALPHGGYPDEVYGAEFGLHAELNNLPWDATIVEDSPDRVAVNFKTKGVRMPVAADMTLSLEEGSSTLKLSKTAINEGEEDVEIVWLEHIAIGPPFLSDKCRLYVPDCKVLTHPETFVDTQKLALGWEGDWPMVPSVDGGEIDFREIPPKEDRSLDMAYMTGMSEGWYAVHNKQTKVGFAVSFPSDVFQYLWYWRNLGGGWGYPWYGRCYNVGLEPCTSWDNRGLRHSMENGSARPLAAGDTLTVEITASAFVGDGDVTSVSPEGTLTWD